MPTPPSAPLRAVAIPDGIADIAAAAEAAADAAAEAETPRRRPPPRRWPRPRRLRARSPDAAAPARPAARPRRGPSRGRPHRQGSRPSSLTPSVPWPSTELGLAGAVTALEQATEALERARIGNVAADLARHLHVGDDCPVCGRRSRRLVDGRRRRPRRRRTRPSPPPRGRTGGPRRARRPRGHPGRLPQPARRTRPRERAALAERLAGAPSSEDIDARLGDGRHRRRSRWPRPGAPTQVARRSAADARAAADAARREVAAARARFAAVRDAVAGLGPPAPADDLAADWAALDRWAASTIEDARPAAGRRPIRRATPRRSDRPSGSACSSTSAVTAGVRVGSRRRAARRLRRRGRHRPGPAAPSSSPNATGAAELRAERPTLDEHRQVHELLADQLGARGFEAWLLDEALDALLVGASAWLEQLSSGRYAMTVDDKNQFAVIDHANADERRLARTLSGGETFLASLALALALAERVTELSASGATSLDAIFLDEGFGTLDPATLDVVATAIEELGATGRMVGVISHVRELAERVPGPVRDHQGSRAPARSGGSTHEGATPMRSRVEQWAPEYGTSVEAGALDESQAAGRRQRRAAGRRVAAARPRRPARSVPAELAFVDGVRRVEARVWVTDDAGAMHQGICASYAAGVVRCNGAATVVDAAVQRSLFCDGPDLAPIDTRHGRFGVRQVAVRVARCAVASGSRPPWATSSTRCPPRSPPTASCRRRAAPRAAIDAPRRRLREDPPRGLPARASSATSSSRSRPGQRTPVFLIGDVFRRWSWYLRLPGRPVARLGRRRALRGQPRSHRRRGAGPGRQLRAGAAPLRVRGPQGQPGAPEPVSHRRSRARAAPPPGRSPGSSTGPCALRHRSRRGWQDRTMGRVTRSGRRRPVGRALALVACIVLAACGEPSRVDADAAVVVSGTAVAADGSPLAGRPVRLGTGVSTSDGALGFLTLGLACTGGGCQGDVVDTTTDGAGPVLVRPARSGHAVVVR